MTPIIKLLIGDSGGIKDSGGNKNKDTYTIKLIQPRPNLFPEHYKDLKDKL